MSVLQPSDEAATKKPNNPTRVWMFSVIHSFIHSFIPPFVAPLCRKNEDEGEIQGGLHGPPETRAGEGVSLQQIHHHQEEIRAGCQPGPLGETGMSELTCDRRAELQMIYDAAADVL